MFIWFKDWIKLFGFDFECGCFGCYWLLFVIDKWLVCYGFMEVVGDCWWLIFGVVYMVMVVKCVCGMCFVGLIKMKKFVFVLGLMLVVFLIIY